MTDRRTLVMAILFSLSPMVLIGQEVFEVRQADVNSSFRAVSVVNNEVAWVAGSNGFVGLSLDGAENWNFMRIPGHDSSQFRSIYAFDERTAVVANAGSPAVILRTENQGESWSEVYRDQNPAAFIDGLDFWNETAGMAYGDPKDGRLNIIKSEDAGKTWTEDLSDSRPLLSEGEASFAASGTGIRTYPPCMTMISTGGKLSRLFKSHDCGVSWEEVTAIMLKGPETSGIFSSHFKDDLNGIVVGGDHALMEEKSDHIFITKDGGENWRQPENPTRGYRECVEHIVGSTWMAIGPTGIDVSNDDGMNWKPLSNQQGFHVIRRARNGELIVLAGSNGKTANFHVSQFKSK
ncbi:MAG: YCF48-related protein [Vicingaceae bacterium]